MSAEFTWIDKYFAPLSGKGSLNLKDDCAMFGDVAISCDTSVQGVHFPKGLTPSAIARRSLRVALSDLAAMGAQPFGYLVALCLPPNTSDDWVRGFASGLELDQAEFNIKLLGGDTTKTLGEISVSVTVLGKTKSPIKRSGARAGDGIYLSCGIGMAAIGLDAFSGGDLENKAAIDAFLLPKPYIELGIAANGVANAAIDISDGLLADIGHMASASGVEAILYEEQIKTSGGRRALSFGDDYVLALSIPDKDAEKLSQFGIYKIGEFKCGNPDVRVLDASGCAIEFKKSGWQHF